MVYLDLRNWHNRQTTGCCQISTCDNGQGLEMRVLRQNRTVSKNYMTVNAVFTRRQSPSGFIEYLTKRQKEPVSKLAAWLRDCNKHHSQCTVSETPPLPSRVLHINQQTSTVRLISGTGLRGEYAALSYCWGGHNPITTTTETLKRHEAGIEISRLPQLFQDAVKVTLSLGLTYLWIDALCIVQDDFQEWAQEAARMADVFSNTYITIAATAASSPNAHLLRLESPVRIEFDNLDHTRNTYHFNLKQDLRLQHFDVIAGAPLNKRAWTLQELMLSDRTVHFATDQVHWHCRHLASSSNGRYQNLNGALVENHSYGPDIDLGLRGQSKVYKHKTGIGPYADWWHVVEDYSRRSLTFQRDKLVALQGISTVFASIYSDESLSGIWRKDLPSGLLWTANEWSRSEPTGLEDLPSWSWASLNCRIDGALLQDSQACVEVLEASPRRLLMRGALWHKGRGHFVNYPRRTQLVDTYPPGTDALAAAKVDIVDDTEYHHALYPTEIYLLPVCVGSSDVEEEKITAGLMVTPLDTGDGFRRVGFFKSRGGSTALDREKLYGWATKPKPWQSMVIQLV